MIESLGKPSGNILHVMRAQDAATPADQQVTEAVGSGPFTFVREEWTPGDRVVYTKYEDYLPRDDEPSGQAGAKIAKVDRVEWIYIPDANTATQALVAGEVDIYDIPPTDLLGMMEITGEIEIRVLDRLGKQGYARFNHLHHPFDNVLARRAVLMARDQTAYMSAMIGDPRFWEECYSFFVCGSPNETLTGADAYMQPNLEEARRLVEESGYDGRPIVIMDPTDQLIIHNNTLVTAQLMREIGFNVDLQAMDWSSLTSRRPVKDDPAAPGSAGWHIFHTWSLGLELTSPLANFGITSACDQSGWFGWACNERIEELRTAWVSETDPAVRREIVEELHAEVYEHVPYVPAGQFFAPIAYRTNVTGILDTPLLVLWNIERD
jgi:peptide/nickel transport system substrate-binding protein